MKRTRLRLSVSLILAFLVAMAAISSAPPVFTQQSHPLLTGTLWLYVPATISESDGSVSYTVLMVSEEDRDPFLGARLSFNVSSSDDVARASDDFVAVDDDFTFIASDFTRVETLHGSGTYRYVATATGQVTLIDDPLVESDESFTLTLSTTTTTEATIATATHRVVIEDDDNYGLAVSVDTVSIVEGQTDDITVTASVTPEADSCVVGFPIILDIQLSGSATATDDYTHDFGDGGSTLSSIRIPPCADSVEWTMSFAAVLDMSSDPGETIVLTAVDRTGGSALETPSTTTSATVEIQDALAGRFVDSTIPASYSYGSDFTLQIAFSDDIATSDSNLKYHAFDVTNGSVARVGQEQGRSDLWNITIRPNEPDTITVALSANRPCDDLGAICTAGSEQLSNRVEARILADKPRPRDIRSVRVHENSVELSWETPEYPQWRTLTGYRLHRFEGSAGRHQQQFEVPLPDSQAISTTVYFTDSTVQPRTAYSYWIGAIYQDVGSSYMRRLDVTTPTPLSGTLSIEAPATVSEGDGSVSYTVRMLLAEDQQPSTNARLSVNVSSSNDVAYAPHDFVAVDDDFTFTGSDFTRVEMPQDSGTYRYVATATGQVALIDDPLVESDESFTLTLSTTTATEATIAASTRQVVIENDDNYGLAVSVNPESIVEGQTADVIVTASVTPEADSCVVGFPIILDIQLSGSATATDDYTHDFGDGGSTLSSIRIPPCADSVEWTMSFAAVLDMSSDPGETIVLTAVDRTGGSALETPSTTTSATVEIQDALAGRFLESTIPEWHDGTSEFTTQIAFSEDINTSVTDFRHYSLIVTAGDIRNVSLVENRKDLWEIIIRPLGNVDVTVALRTVQGCNTNGAICTADDKQLSNHIETRMRYDRPPLTDLRIIGVASGSVELSWETPDYPEWRTLTGYRVYRNAKLEEGYGSEALGFGNILQDSQSTSTTVYFTDPTVEPESTYLYRVFAVYRDVGSSPSVSTGDVTTPPPPLSGTLSLEVPATISESDGVSATTTTLLIRVPPTDFRVTDVTHQRAVLRWTAPQVPEGQVLTGYQITRTGGGAERSTDLSATNVSYSASSLDSNTVYEFTLRARYSDSGLQGGLSDGVSATTATLLIRVPPTDFRVTDVTHQRAVLRWTAPQVPEGQVLTGYQITRTGGGAERSTDLSATNVSYSASSLDSNTVYEFTLRARYSDSGLQGGLSDGVSATTATLLIRVPPTDFRVTDVTHQRAVLRWTAPQVPEGQVLTGYQITRTGGGAERSTDLSATNVSYSASSLDSNTVYEFTLRARYSDSGLQGGLSDGVSTAAATLLIRVPPTDFRVTDVTHQRAVLRWTAPQVPEGQVLTGYQITRTGGGAERSTDLSATNVSYSASSLDSNTVYEFTLRARYSDSGLQGGLSDGVSTAAATLLIRVPPTDFRVTDVTHQRAVLRWTAPQVPEGQVLTGYQITRTGGGAERSTDLSATNVSYSASSLDSNTVYEFTLRARYSDSGLQGGLSDGVSTAAATLLIRVPPTDFRVTDVTHQRAVLRWTAPQVPEGQVLTGYQITRTGGGAERSTDLSATNVSYSASSLDSNTVYEFTLRARYSDSGLQGGLSDGVSAITTTLTVPLTAEFQNAPDSHTGSGFIFRVLFSEAISSSYTTLRDHSFVVTNGSVTRARRLDRRSDYWEITVTPDSNEDVTIGLQANLACDAEGAICAGNKRLSSGPEVTVSGRVTVDP